MSKNDRKPPFLDDCICLVLRGKGVQSKSLLKSKKILDMCIAKEKYEKIKLILWYTIK